ncbi:MAG: hypothetical protein HYY84_01610 [Deltaproteobacteria bacterium]|nr:hypothetical protein [Deltaproteobacteria bacterium]
MATDNGIGRVKSFVDKNLFVVGLATLLISVSLVAILIINPGALTSFSDGPFAKGMKAGVGLGAALCFAAFLYTIIRALRLRKR